ncbi:MAG: NUDIX hydrolase, partial [Cyanobacteria bacterium HKST-UBA02]|nr:NUDIX hydrolase [Cyanobacteria bacterium HKST-UBA02]
LGFAWRRYLSTAATAVVFLCMLAGFCYFVGNLALLDMGSILLVASIFTLCGTELSPVRQAPAVPPQYRYCPNCAHPLEKRLFEDIEKLACPECSFVYWNNPIVVGVAIIPSGDGVVLVKRKFEPRAGMWALPAGFGEPRELPSDTAIRESAEEANVDIEIDRLLAVEGSTERNHALVFYLAKPIDKEPSPGSDALEAKVFALDELPELAFSSHQKVLRAWIESRHQ